MLQGSSESYVQPFHLKIMSFILQIFLTLVLGYAAVVLVMYLKQDSFIYHPVATTHQGELPPGSEAFTEKRGDVELKGWLVNKRYANQALIIYYGGNAEDVYHNIEDFEAIQAASLFVSYRGFGGSGGKPSEMALLEDALAVFDRVQIDLRPPKIYLMGRSLGSGVAAFVAAKREVTGLILITPFDSLTAVARQAYPWLPVNWLLRHRFPSTDYARQITAPVLILYGGQDRLVTPERTRNLINHLAGDKEIVYIQRAGHATISMSRLYWASILEFLGGEKVTAASL